LGFLPSLSQASRDCPPFQARVVKPKISTFTPQRSSVRANMSAQVAATELAFGAGTLWASQRAAGQVVRIDPTTGKQAFAPIHVGNGPTGIAFGHGAAWVANSLDGTVYRIDPETNSVTALVTTGNGPDAVAADARGIWVSNQFDGNGESVPNALSTDNLNNVEAVHLAAPVPGQYTVRVRGHNVVQDVHGDTNALGQDFALVISALTPPPGAGLIFFDHNFYTVPGQIKISLLETNLAGQPSVTITARSTSGQGTTFIFLLPLHQPKGDKPHA
jgi:YVTN family beta-propeller protein